MLKHGSRGQVAGKRRFRAVALLLLSLAFLWPAAAASAAEGSIDHVEVDGEKVKVLYSVSGLTAGEAPDPDTITVSLDGEPVEFKAELAKDSSGTVRRTAVLALDTSDSMETDEKFVEAKAAANLFLDSIPDDIYVGLVTFSSAVTEVQEPTKDHEALKSLIDGLTLSRGTRLYDGVVQAVALTGDQGARSVLVLSDGKDSTSTPIDKATSAIKKAEVKVDVIALANSEADKALLSPLADAGNGSVLSANDPAALSEVFAAEAQALSQQVLVTLTPSLDQVGAEGTLKVSVDAGGETITDEAFVTMPSSGNAPGAAETQNLQSTETGLDIPATWMWAGLAAAAVAVGFLVITAVGGVGTPKQDAVSASIEAYTRKGARKLAQAANAPQTAPSVTQQAVAVAEKALGGNKGLEASLGGRLESGGLALKPAEWLLIHAGIAVTAGLAGVLLGGGRVLLMVLGVVLGLALPWFYLGWRKRRRTKAFRGQLADTLQLMAGSLSAGLSLAQSVDTVVREGTEPMAGEFRRALVEARLGVDIEDALAGIAERMQSQDFEWVVMSIRIQREVGGNLSELLNTVAETIREREYLERQVQSLSAEGRLSVWILGGLPPGFMGYLLLANPDYIRPMYTTPMGWMMLVVMGVLLTVGIFWMKKLVKVEV